MIFLRTIISFLKDSEFRDLLFTTLVILALGMIMYQFLEGWGWLDAQYFSVLSLTTVGYGHFILKQRSCINAVSKFIG